MRSSRRRKPNPVRDSLVFWSLVLFLAAGVAVAGFVMGRDWLGRRMASVDMTPGAPRMLPTDEDPSAGRGAKAQNAPAKAEAKIEEREPDAAELRKIDAGRDSGPQDGAELHHEGDEADESKPAPSRAEADDGGSSDEPDRPRRGRPRHSKGRFVVTAGAYSTAANAQRAVAKLKDAGYSPAVELAEVNGREVRRVVVEATDSRSEAEELREQLEQEGIRAGIIAND